MQKQTSHMRFLTAHRWRYIFFYERSVSAFLKKIIQIMNYILHDSYLKCYLIHVLLSQFMCLLGGDYCKVWNILINKVPSAKIWLSFDWWLIFNRSVTHQNIRNCYLVYITYLMLKTNSFQTFLKKNVFIVLPIPYINRISDGEGKMDKFGFFSISLFLMAISF